MRNMRYDTFIKQLLFLLQTFIFITCAHAQDQSKCIETLEGQVKEIWVMNNSMLLQAQKKLTDRAQSCMQAGRCDKPGVLIFLMEATVDEEFVKVQRQKLSIIKEFYRNVKKLKDNPCAALPELKPTMNQLTKLNTIQFDRLSILISEYVSTLEAKN